MVGKPYRGRRWRTAREISARRLTHLKRPTLGIPPSAFVTMLSFPPYSDFDSRFSATLTLQESFCRCGPRHAQADRLPPRRHTESPFPAPRRFRSASTCNRRRAIAKDSWWPVVEHREGS